MVVPHKTGLDPDFLTAIVLATLPELADSPDVACYLTRDLLIPEGPAVLETADSLNNVLGVQLIDLSICTSPLQAQLACEDLHKACQHPNDYHTRLCSHIKQGKSFQAALDDSRAVDTRYPRDVHKKFLKRGMMTQSDCIRGIHVCRQCHNTIHRSFDNETLAERLHSLDSLMEQDVMQKWVAYAQKQKPRAVVGHRVAR